MSKKMEEIARKMKNDYQKQWRQQNPDKVRKYNRDYWVRRAAEMQESK